MAVHQTASNFAERDERPMQKIVVVGGCGRVGLPLGLAFAETAKLSIFLFDSDKEKVKKFNEKQALFVEPGVDELIDKHVGKTVVATSDNACIRDADFVIVAIGTPVHTDRKPEAAEFLKSVSEILSLMKTNALLVIRSTVLPGVTRSVFDMIADSGKSIQVAFCPERTAQGKAMQELRTLPQIVSAFDEAALLSSKLLFNLITPEIIELTPAEAELAKLFTNTWRYINFAVSNEFYTIAESHGIDFNRVSEAMKRDYPRLSGLASPGFCAGPCLVKDTQQLAAYSGNENFLLGSAALKINDGLPNFIVEQLKSIDLSSKTVGILGMAFKANTDESRDSLCYKLRDLLASHARTVLCTDPYIADSSFYPLDMVLQESDVLILGTPHSLYQDVRISPDKTFVDCWGFWPDRTPDGVLLEACSIRVE
jgi:UDP-N-acetyl-D-mannosaminuronic acid dehydrogenase